MARATLLTVTTGGIDTTQRAAPTRHHKASKRRTQWQRWVNDPRTLRHLPTVMAVAVIAGCLARWRQRWLIPGRATYLLDVHATVVDGTGIAPNQYRPLVPLLCDLLAQSLSLTVPQTILAVDTVFAVVACAAVWVMCRRLDPPQAPPLVLAGAVGFAWLFARLDHWSPETWLLVALVAVVANELTKQAPSWATVAVCATLMLGARADYAATLGATLILIGLVHRHWTPPLLGVAAGAGAAAAAVVWPALYPQAHYQVDVVQLPFNLSLGSWLQVVPWYLPLLAAPLLLVLRDRTWPPMWPALVWFTTEFAAVFIVGRVEESRLFMPFAALLGIAAVMAYQRLAAGEPTSR